MASDIPTRPTGARRSSGKMPTSPDLESAENVEIPGLAASLPKLDILSFANASIIRGTAEYLTTKLTGRGHSCPHFPKYRVEDKKSPYPSRLGFFHRTDSNFSYLDTSKLCADCCADVVPEGYNAWSIFTKNSKAGESEEAQAEQSHGGSLDRRWLDLPSSPEFYPEAFQAGTEGFIDGPVRERPRFAKDIAVAIAKSITADPVTIPMPLVAEAKEAWQWLKAQGKPFYIDQLHLTKKWSPLAERNAALDATVSAESGTAFDAATIIKPKKSTSMTKPKKAATVTKAKKLTLKDTVASPVELATEGQPPSVAKPKNSKASEIVASPVEIAAGNEQLTKVN